MEIWLIDHYAVPPEYYPLARQTNFAKYLMRLGHTVKIFAASSVHNSDINLISSKERYEEKNYEGITYVLVHCRQYSNGVQRVINMFEFAFWLPKVCNRYQKPDAIVSTSMTPLACAQGVRMARKYGCRNIAQISDLWPETLVAYDIAGKYNIAVLFLRKVEKWIYKNAERIVFTMEGAYDYIIEQGWEKKIPREKVAYINNGVDLELFDYNRNNFVLEDIDLDDSSKFKVVYVGSIRRVNNLGLLLDVAKKIKNPHVIFLIWGEGEEKEALIERVKKENITNVVFKGRADKKYIPYITSCADLNIAHNTSTPLFRFGISFNKIFDYFAAGKPILSDFPCKYNPVVMMQAGVTVNEPTADNVARKIEEIVDMDKEEYASFCKNARQASHIYDFKVLTDKLIEVIEER